MALIRLNFYSESLTDSTAAYIVAPVEKCRKGSYPVCVLLPPLGDNYTQWQRHTDLDLLAERRGCMVVCPDLRLSCGMNMKYGLRFYDMLQREIPQLLRTYFPADTERMTVCGFREGAYTAAYLAFCMPRQYRKAVMISCGSLTDEDVTADARFENIWGDAGEDGWLETYDLKSLYTRNSVHPDVAVIYGTEDRYARSAGCLGEFIQKMNPENQRIHVEKLPGRIEWNDCQGILDRALI
ncbi:MAG: alpha/beta hydrolase-fold protein [Eubacteriales bacterium]|nr:alpha/beta hydrolase-fold protein [Eubacteriales bacterium]